MCCASSATLLDFQSHHNHCNIASRQSRAHFGVVFFIITQIDSQASHQLPPSTATQQFNLATPPLLLLVTPKYSNPFYSEQKINLAITFPKSTPEIFQVHMLSITVLVPPPLQWRLNHTHHIPTRGCVAISFGHET